MDRQSNRFGLGITGPKELNGASDLINHFKLLRHHEFFCKKMIPGPVSQAHYLKDVVGSTDISKGDGMQLRQLIQNEPCATKRSRDIQAFDLVDLTEAFKFRGSVIIPRIVQPGPSETELKDDGKLGDRIREMDRGIRKPTKILEHQNKHMGDDKKANRSHKREATEARLEEKIRTRGGDDYHNGFPQQKRK